VDAFLAGMPHLLMGLLIGIGKLLSATEVYPPSQAVSSFVGVFLGLLVVVVLIAAWRLGWPLWSASWYLYGTWVGMVIIALGIERLDLNQPWRYNDALFLGWVILILIGYFRLLIKDRLKGLLAIAFIFPILGVPMLEFVPNPIEGWVGIGLGLMAALAVGGIMRMGDFRTALGLVIVVNVIAGFTLAYVGEYKMTDLPSNIPAHVPRFTNFLELLTLYSVFALGLIAAPFVLQGLWDIGKRRLYS
jgi:hypothetical protein